MTRRSRPARLLMLTVALLLCVAGEVVFVLLIAIKTPDVDPSPIQIVGAVGLWACYFGGASVARRLDGALADWRTERRMIAEAKADVREQVMDEWTAKILAEREAGIPPTFYRWDTDHWTPIDVEHPVTLWVKIAHDDTAALAPCKPEGTDE